MSETNVSGMVQRVLGVFVRIGESGITGLRACEIAQLERLRADQVTRCVANLVEAGLVAEHAERVGVWRISPRISRIAVAVMRDIHVSKVRLAEVEQRYLGT